MHINLGRSSTEISSISASFFFNELRHERDLSLMHSLYQDMTLSTIVFPNIILVKDSISRSVHVGDNCLFDNNDRLIVLCTSNSKYSCRITKQSLHLQSILFLRINELLIFYV